MFLLKSGLKMYKKSVSSSVRFHCGFQIILKFCSNPGFFRATPFFHSLAVLVYVQCWASYFVKVTSYILHITCNRTI